MPCAPAWAARTRTPLAHSLSACPSQFYAPWCGHCRSLQSDWEKTARALDGIVNVAAVDADAHPSLGQQFGVQGTRPSYAPPLSVLLAVDWHGAVAAIVCSPTKRQPPRQQSPPPPPHLD